MRQNIINLNYGKKYVGIFYDEYIYNKFKFIEKPSRSYFPYEKFPDKQKSNNFP